MDTLNTFIKKIFNVKWTIGKIIKTALLAIVALLAISLVLSVFKWALGIQGDNYGRNNDFGFNIQQAFEEPEMLLNYASQDEDMMDGGFGGARSVRSAKMMAPQSITMGESGRTMPSFDDGDKISKDAEDFETREYSAQYERSNIEPVCDAFEALKPLTYVVFANANKNDTYCNYRFKVELAHEDEIINQIKKLSPKDFNARTFTLERSITNNTNEVEILKKKLEMLDSLLKNAQEKYASLRTSGNTNALVQAINNEINLIERITNQKLTVQSRIDRLTNSGTSQTERIDYSQFNVSVSERKFINWSTMSDSWKHAFERFITNISTILQGLTIGLVLFVLTLIKFIVFISISVLVLVSATKFLFSLSKRIWHNK